MFEHLGHFVMLETLAAEIDITAAVFSSPFPEDKIKLQSFLGAWDVYRQFIKDLESRERALNTMLKKGDEPERDKPSSDQAKSFRDRHDALVHPQVLALPKRDRSLVI